MGADHPPHRARGRLAGAMIVKDGYDLVLISHHPHCRRGIWRMGRATGVCGS
jgi:hypothetical protein